MFNPLLLAGVAAGGYWAIQKWRHRDVLPPAPPTALVSGSQSMTGVHPTAGPVHVNVAAAPSTTFLPSTLAPTVVMAIPPSGMQQIPLHLANMANMPGGNISTIVTPESNISSCQNGLNLLGAAPPLATDGKVGPKTIAATKAFQTMQGMNPTGTLDPKTKGAIGMALGALAQGGSS